MPIPLNKTYFFDIMCAYTEVQYRKLYTFKNLFIIAHSLLQEIGFVSCSVLKETAHIWILILMPIPFNKT